MVNILKIYFEGSQIRRVAVNSNVINTFKYLQEKVQSLFQLTTPNAFLIHWKDSEGDLILISTDEELAQAVANADEELLKLYVSMAKGYKESNRDNGEVKEAHPFVVCDGCNKDVYGHRFKCLQCKDYDLCSNCVAGGTHALHDMIRLSKPVYIPREWVFMGARKIWKSMFNHRPCSMLFDTMAANVPPFAKTAEGNAAAGTTTSQQSSSAGADKPQKKTEKTEPCLWPGLFKEFLNGDFVDAQKLFTEKFSDVIKNVQGNIEVKLDNPFLANNPLFEFKMNPQPNESASQTQEKPQPNASASQTQENPQPNGSSKQPQEEPSGSKMQNREEIRKPSLPPNVTSWVTEPEKVDDPTPTMVPERIETEGIAQAAASETTDEQIGCPEGWTFLGNEEQVKATTPKTADDKVKYPDLEEIDNMTDKCHTIQSTNPLIISAVETMQTMGFTNEGGWLERLLIAKDGNINAVLDALYPRINRG